MSALKPTNAKAAPKRQAMGRPREFDVDEALDRAMRVFWAKGYEGTSLDDLLAAMRIGRGSLYKAFTDKRSLYLATLRRYDAEVVGRAVRELRGGAGDGKERIARLLQSVADAVENGNDRTGCFLCNASVDQAPHDESVAVQVRASIDRLEAAFFEALGSGGYEDAERKSRAKQLTAEYFGLRVLAKTGGEVAQLRSLIDAIVARL